MTTESIKDVQALINGRADKKLQDDINEINRFFLKEKNSL